VATIITVHGTFSKGPEEGSEWWQKGSVFERDVRDYVATEDGLLEFKPYTWDGENSQSSRQQAGQDLARLLLKDHNDGSGCALVGHSHGGSLIENAVAILTTVRGRRGAPISIITVGTPFPIGKLNPSVYARLSAPMKVAYATLYTLVNVFVLITIASWFVDRTPLVDVGLLGFSLLFSWLSVLVFVLISRATRRTSWFYKKKERGAPDAVNILCLHHKHDEAITGLKSLSSARRKIFTDSFSANFTSSLLIIAVPAVILIAMLLTVVFFYAFAPALDRDIKLAILAGVAILSSMFVLLVSLSLPQIASRPLASLLNRLAWFQIVQRALGGDGKVDVLTGVEDRPFWSNASTTGLPDELEDELSRLADEAASKALPKLRRAISQLAFAVSNQGDADAIGRYLTWEELIHTVYFKAARFRKLVCYVIAHSPGFRPSEKLKADPDYEKLAEWLAEIQGQASRESDAQVGEQIR